MCGIAGAWAPNQGGDELGRSVERMVGSLRHRGPNDNGIFAAEGMAFGMSRLSIIDVAGGHQPIANEDGSITIICNGEIYNHAELRPRLQKKGHTFRTASDVEVILHLYEDHGPECLTDVEGMFAVAIWDQRQRRLFLGRDRLGIKPLYYAWTGSSLLFGSELKAIVSAGSIDLHPDPQAIDLYFTLGYVPAPLSIYKEVRKLDPGHVLVVDDGGLKLHRYWSLRFEPNEALDETECEEQFLDLFRRAISSHLMSEVPLGAFLSGGVDSGLVVALMSEQGAAPVQTFTIGFSGDAGGYLDERGYARAISKQYGTKHTEFEIEPRLDDVLGKIVDAFDEPFADDSVIPTYYISGLARQSVTVALTGLGGDELFAGYERHLGYTLSGRFDQIPGWVRNNLVVPAIDRLPERRDGHYTINHMKRFARASSLQPWERYLSYVTVANDALKARLFTPEAKRSLAACEPLNGSDPIRRVQPSASSARLNDALRFDTQLYLPDDILALTDRLSMAHALELRVPFLDHRLVEFCATIPERLKIRNFNKKYLLKRVAGRFLPADVINHRKQGFAAPMASWLRGGLRDFVKESLAPERLAKYGFLDPRPVQELLDQHLERRESNDKQLFAVLMFQKWCERFL